MKKSNESFLIQAQECHGNRYNYERVIYQGCKHKVEIICERHGSFFVTPNNHISNLSGCPSCAVLTYGSTARNRAAETFIPYCKNIHNNKYDYSETHYTTSHEFITIICPHHGKFTMRAYSHKQGQGCCDCNNILKSQRLTSNTATFIKKSNIVHDFKYDYSKSVYTYATEKLTITCLTHGDFLQRPSQHLQGEGCPNCGKRNWFAEQGGYSLDFFNRNPHLQRELGILYCIMFTSENETFYKIGITKNTIGERFHWGYSQYVLTPIFEYKSTLYDVWTIEQNLLSLLQPFRYVPVHRIGGWTECLNRNIDTYELKQLLIR